MGRVHVAAVGSSICGDVPDAGAYEHESAAGVGEATDDAGAASDFLFNRSIILFARSLIRWFAENSPSR